MEDSCRELVLTGATTVEEARKPSPRWSKEEEGGCQKCGDSSKLKEKDHA